MSATSRDVRIKRAYEEASPEDGTRVLVDRLWPRGLSKERARVDEWLKAVAPSTELRTWYGHDPARFDEFRARYRDELAREPARGAYEQLAALARQGRLTLLCGAKDAARSNADVLREELLS